MIFITDQVYVITVGQVGQSQTFKTNQSFERVVGQEEEKEIRVCEVCTSDVKDESALLCFVCAAVLFDIWSRTFEYGNTKGLEYKEKN